MRKFDASLILVFTSNGSAQVHLIDFQFMPSVQKYYQFIVVSV